MNTCEQMELADSILRKLFPLDPYAIVAGGAPRDWYFGEDAEDIDVFFHDINSSTVVREKLKHLGFDVSHGNEGEFLPPHYKMNPNLKAVFDCVVDGQKVQFLNMNLPTFKSVVPEFPLSICKAWYKNGKLKVDKDFQRGVNHNAIVKTNKLYANENVYLNKIIAKFPEYKYYESWEELAQHLLDKEV